MKIEIKPRTKKQAANAEMLAFHLWMQKINNTYFADVERMSLAYQKVYKSNTK